MKSRTKSSPSKRQPGKATTSRNEHEIEELEEGEVSNVDVRLNALQGDDDVDEDFEPDLEETSSETETEQDLEPG